MYLINNALPIEAKTECNMKKQGGPHDDMEIIAIVQNEEKTLMNTNFSFLSI